MALQAKSAASIAIESSRGSEATQLRTLRSALLTTLFSVGAPGFEPGTS
jgi:hypothetical protein